MGLRDRFRSGLARQLGRPEGLRGRIVGRGLNKGNRAAADIGFGGGLGLELLLERVGTEGRVVGVELSDTMLTVAEKRFGAECSDGRLTLLNGTMGDLPLDDGSLDALITTNTVYFVEDLERAFGEITRVLSPTGRAVIGVADPAWMASMPVTAHGFRLRPIDEIVTMLRTAGFSEVRDEPVTGDERPFRLLVARVGGSSAHP